MKLYTAFLYGDSTEPHCTHKYLGKLDPTGEQEVRKVLDHFFRKPRHLPPVTFDKVDFFGPGGKIRVLRPSTDAELFPNLRRVLDLYATDSYGPYKPHVTEKTLSAIDNPFVYYALCCKDEILVKYLLEVAP